MKITMYELYRKIYDENPPKHIKVYDEDWYWNDYDGYVTKESLKTTPDAQIYLMDRYRTFMNLDKEVEIIEEPKKIEYPIFLHKTAPSETTGDQMPNWRNLIDCNFEYLNKTICQLIDEINNLKEE